MEECKHVGESKDEKMKVEIEGDELWITYRPPYEEDDSYMWIKVKFCPFCGKKLEESA